MYETHHGFTAIIGIGVIHVVSIRGIEQHRMQKHFIRAERTHETRTYLGPFVNNIPGKCLSDGEPVGSFPENEFGTSKTINMQQKALRHEHYSFDLANVSPDSIFAKDGRWQFCLEFFASSSRRSPKTARIPFLHAVRKRSRSNPCCEEVNRIRK